MYSVVCIKINGSLKSQNGPKHSMILGDLHVDNNQAHFIISYIPIHKVW